MAEPARPVPPNSRWRTARRPWSCVNDGAADTPANCQRVILPGDRYLQYATVCDGQFCTPCANHLGWADATKAPEWTEETRPVGDHDWEKQGQSPDFGPLYRCRTCGITSAYDTNDRRCTSSLERRLVCQLVTPWEPVDEAQPHPASTPGGTA